MDNIDQIDDAIEVIDSEVEDATSHIPIYTISSYPTDPSLELLHQRWERGEIEIPRFQRGWVWKHAQASQFGRILFAGASGFLVYSCIGINSHSILSSLTANRGCERYGASLKAIFLMDKISTSVTLTSVGMANAMPT